MLRPYRSKMGRSTIHKSAMEADKAIIADGLQSIKCFWRKYDSI